ncbi:membrane protein [Yersinia entomophaga]|uniref:Membrane protein n=1 Tax=Yersinia entomophaga TaxID=935293 RepID=A0ABN4Q1X6_YERET|nr:MULTISPECIES: hypothetical protein [Yersinia]ANI31686.1 membrane protein [Yersinia entomophaga]OWF87129.1 hypothetical protein B4914_13010 [Yersinia entomophaga]
MIFVILWFVIAGLSEFLVWGRPLLMALLSLIFLAVGGLWIYKVRKIQVNTLLPSEGKTKRISNLNLIFSVGILAIHAITLLLFG